MLNNLELDRRGNTMATIALGSVHQPMELRSFRSMSPEEYAQERNPETFIDALQMTAKGFENFIYYRDHF
jgi:hypothetical protein